MLVTVLKNFLRSFWSKVSYLWSDLILVSNVGYFFTINCTNCIKIKVRIYQRFVGWNSERKKNNKNNKKTTLNLNYISFRAIYTRESLLKGRTSTVGLHVLTSSNQLLFVRKLYFYFFFAKNCFNEEPSP